MRAFFPSLLLLACAIVASDLMLRGSGFFPEPSISQVGLLSLLIGLLIASRKTFYGLLLPIALLYAGYAPIGLTFGGPSYQYVASVFATDLQESKEFFAQIPWRNLATALAIPLLLGVGHWLARRYQLRPQRNATFLTLSVLAYFLASEPAKFLREGAAAMQQVYAELTRLNSLSIASEWGQSTLAEGGYDDYVLVIGESARKDYHHAYGYPIANTPFMSTANGTLIDGLTAGGTNTIASLKLMLTLPDTQTWQGNYGLNVIDLVKSAGIRTYWLSNQGYLGTFDTPISAIANKSDYRFFLKSGDSLNQNVSDFNLLPKFQALLAEKAVGKRFIVLHLYGSHPISCDRLTDYPKLFDDRQLDPKYHSLNCYVSSIKKTDALLEKVYQALRQNQHDQQRRFSMIYFADHGLAHHISEKSIEIHNSSGKSQLHFNVPLFKISSDDQDRKQYQAVKSGLNFTNGLANWIGIRNPKLNPERDLFSPQSDESDYGLKAIIDTFDAPLDPAVVIPH